MTSELRPCPFCGGEVQKKIGMFGLNFFDCRGCGAEVSFDNIYYNTFKEEVVNAWNRRAGESDDV